MKEKLTQFDEFETIKFDSHSKTKYRHMVWLCGSAGSNKRPNSLYISIDIADEIGLKEGETYRFDIQISKDKKTFALYFNPVGLCYMKDRRCVNVHLCDIISAKLSLAYQNTICIHEFDAYTDVENSRIIFTPIIKETQ